MKEFREMAEAAGWLFAHGQGWCTVIIHGDPYEWRHDRGLERKYTTEFYWRKT